MKDRTTQLPASTHMWINFFFLFWKLKKMKIENRRGKIEPKEKQDSEQRSK